LGSCVGGRRHPGSEQRLTAVTGAESCSVSGRIC
jgi:hypothetical protein